MFNPNRVLRTPLILSAFFSLWTLTAVGQASFDLESTLSKLAVYDYGQSREPAALLTEYVQNPQRTPAEVKDVEKRLGQFLKSSASDVGKDQICRLLSFIGTADSVPVLGDLLVASKSSDMARYALERIPGPEAGKALMHALLKTNGKVRIGIIDTLGMRKESIAVTAISGLLKEKDTPTAVAAANALGQIAGPEATKALAQARGKASGELKLQITDAYLRCADQILAGGGKKESLSIYKSLNGPAEPPAIRVAALKGIASVQGKEALPVLIMALKGKEPKEQAMAIRLISDLPGAEITKALVDELPMLPAAAQVQALAALADRGDPGANPAVMAAAKSDSPLIRAAALEAISKLGDSSSVLVLAETAANSNDQVQNSAREGLYRLRGPNVDQAILRLLGESEAKLKVELIRAVGDRGITDGVGALLENARDNNSQVRRESVRSLREIADSAQVPALIDLLVVARSPSERDDVERTLTAAIKRGENARASDVLKAFQSASQEEVKVSLLQTMGDVGDSLYLTVLKRSLSDENSAVRRSAILALSVWPDATPADDLIGVARNSTEENHNVLALRGYIKLITLPSNRSSAACVALLKDAMTIATRETEKKAVLGALPQYACPEALALAQSVLADTTLANEAEIAVKRIQQVLKNKEEQ
jgi:HEAT repeat protein